MDDLREEIARVITANGSFFGDYGDAEDLAGKLLAIPRIAEALKRPSHIPE